MRAIYFIWFFMNSISVFINGQMQCRDESGKVVDWYVVYKFPKVSKGKSPLDTGLKYAYITSDTKTGWTLSKQNITDAKASIFGRTLDSLYVSQLDSSISYINYNDQPPQGDALSGGAHAKGVVAADDTQGIWLIHSVPHFASDETTHAYEYPSTGARYGQIGLCISFKISEFSKITEQLLYMWPHVYSIKISSALNSVNTKALKDENWNSGNFSIRSISSSGGMNFTSFSKSPVDHVDLYADIVAPNLKTNLYVETWRKNPGNPLPSECEKTKTVENVNEISLKFHNSEEMASFGYTEDHSKWAISKTESTPYVCFGDMNRMESQFKRGGGTTCFQTPQVWKYLNEWVSKVDKC